MNKHYAFLSLCSSSLLAVLALLLALACAPAAQAQGPYEPPWETVDGGGGVSGVSAGGGYTLMGTIGQADTGIAGGGGYTLSAGFWPGVGAVPALPSPAPPTLLKPANRTITEATTLDFAWTSSPGADGYLVDLNGSVSDVGDTMGYVANLLSVGAYTWTVAAYDATSTGANAAPWAFMVSGPGGVVTLTGPFTPGQWYPFNGICGKVYFSSTGVLTPVAVVTVTLSYGYPTLNGDGLPRRYDIETDGADFEAQLALCYEDAELMVADIDLVREGDLHAYRYTGGGVWQAYSEVDTANNVVTATAITAFGVWGLGVEEDHPTLLGLSSLLAVPWTGAHLPVALVGVGLLGITTWCLRRRRR